MNGEEKKLEILVLGSGNILFGDDGFGPKVVEHLLQNFELPQRILALDVGTGIQELLFDLILTDAPPKKLLVIDVIDQKAPPGKLFWLQPESLPKSSSPNFSLHLPPARELFLELEKKGVEILLLCCQPARIPDTIQMGLSPPVSDAVLKASEEIYKILMRE